MAHIVAGNFKFLTGNWAGLSFLVDCWPEVLFGCLSHGPLTWIQLTTWQPFLQSQQRERECPPRMTVDLVYCNRACNQCIPSPLAVPLFKEPAAGLLLRRICLRMHKRWASWEVHPSHVCHLPSYLGRNCSSTSF